MKFNSKKRRRSLGGRLVDESLFAAGYHPSPSVSLIETSLPRPRRYKAVLVQNAWNTVSVRLFATLLARYSWRERWRICARRVLAHINMVRADNLVVLTEAARSSMPQSLQQKTLVAPVTLPHDIASWPEDVSSDRLPKGPFVLVPGAVTWYKEPMLALAAAQSFTDNQILFAGPIMSTDCQAAIRAEAHRKRLRVVFATLNREEMLSALKKAEAAIVVSSLETLSFSFGEALTFSSVVIASPIPTHLELAQRLGREAIWLHPGGAQASNALPPVELSVQTVGWKGVRGILEALAEGHHPEPDTLIPRTSLHDSEAGPCDPGLAADAVPVRPSDGS